MSHPYATAKGVLNVRVQNSAPDAELQDLYEEFSRPVPVPHRAVTYHNMSKRDRGNLKMSLPYFVGGSIKGKRHDSNVQARTLITMDIEAKDGQDQPPAPEDVFEKLQDIGAEGWVYTSISHTPAAPRYRVVMPLHEPLQGADLTEQVLQHTTQAAAKRLGILAWCRPESWVLSQPMYLPAKLKDGVFWQGYVQGKHFKAVRKAPDTDGIAEMPEGKMDQVLQAVHAAGLYLNEDPNHKGKHFIRCPFADDHGVVNDTQTVYYEAHYDGNPRPAVKCFDTEPDEGGVPHLTYGTLVRWLREHKYLQQEDEASSEVMDEYDDFLRKASVGQYLQEEPVPREWAWEQFAPVGKVTVLAGPGGVSKSMMMLHLQVYGALGQEWAGFKPNGALRSMYVSYEDDKQELHKRVHGLAQALKEADGGTFDMLYDIQGALRKNLLLYAADDEAFQWLLMRKPDQRSAAERTARVDWLVGLIKHAGIKALVLDPVVYTHNLEESSPGDMALYMQTLTYIAKAAQCAVIVLHHMHKTAAWATLEEINQGSLRGASSFADNSRSVGVLVSLPAKDAPKYGLQNTELRFAVFKHVKHNYSAPLETKIFERRGALLVPRTDLDALSPTELDARKAEEESRRRSAELQLRGRKILEFLMKENGSTGNMIKLGVPMRHSSLKDVLEWLEEEAYMVSRPGPNRSTVYEITKSGRAWCDDEAV